MYRVILRFYEELNYFLPEKRRKRDFEVSFPLRRSVKDLIESLGVPHVEVDLILVHGESVGFDYLVSDGDRISVYPTFESLDISEASRIDRPPLRETRFILDGHLHTLARRLRMLGFDTDYQPNRDDSRLARESRDRSRILLTRDRGLLMRNQVTHGLYVRSTDPDEQLIQILERLDLFDSIRPFTRCIRCNGLIEKLDLDSNGRRLVAEKVPPGVREWCNDYRICRGCGRIYWKGSHFKKMLALISSYLTGSYRNRGHNLRRRNPAL